LHSSIFQFRVDVLMQDLELTFRLNNPNGTVRYENLPDAIPEMLKYFPIRLMKKALHYVNAWIA
jgi:hypothetical protein